MTGNDGRCTHGRYLCVICSADLPDVGAGLVERAPADSSARDRMKRWELACMASNTVSGSNLLKTPNGAYLIDSRPRWFDNGAVAGRVFKFAGARLADIGGFKIDARGVVVHCPAEVRAFLPGANEAQSEPQQSAIAA